MGFIPSLLPRQGFHHDAVNARRVGHEPDLLAPPASGGAVHAEQLAPVRSEHPGHDVEALLLQRQVQEPAGLQRERVDMRPELMRRRREEHPWPFRTGQGKRDRSQRERDSSPATAHEVLL